MAQSVTWEQALEILKELKEKYSLLWPSYARRG